METNRTVRQAYPAPAPAPGYGGPGPGQSCQPCCSPGSAGPPGTPGKNGENVRNSFVDPTHSSKGVLGLVVTFSSYPLYFKKSIILRLYPSMANQSCLFRASQEFQAFQECQVKFYALSDNEEEGVVISTDRYSKALELQATLTTHFLF